MVKADGLAFVTAVYWQDLTEQFKALIDRLRRCEALTNHDLSGKSCLLAACAGGTGRGAVNCLWNLEDSLSHMGMKAVDRLPVVQVNRGYMLDALRGAGRTFGDYLAGRVQFPNLP
ncbi:MAG: NAD(P)H-dependent oxidoreductase, partial [Pyramidobacter sp.]|nr:NAD(P)H-dependent oxidoreductase [Pyramidobacter sp.]